MVPLIWLKRKFLRMCAQGRRTKGESVVSERSAARRGREQGCGAAQRDDEAREEERDAQV